MLSRWENDYLGYLVANAMEQISVAARCALACRIERIADRGQRAATPAA
jgi:hypothetical protein